MTFRDPITSISAVDTNSGGAGVRLYQDTANNKGVLEFSDGITGSTPARMTVTPSNAGRTPTLRLQGMSGGDIGGTTGPTAGPALEMDIVGGSGIYQQVIELQAAASADGSVGRIHLAYGQPAVDHPINLEDGLGNVATWRSPTLTVAFLAWDATAANAPLYRLDAAGVGHVQGIVKLNAGNGSQLSAGTSATVCTLPAGYFNPTRQINRPIVMVNASGAFVAVVWAWITTAGALVVQNSTGSLAAGGYGFLIGMTYSTFGT